MLCGMLRMPLNLSCGCCLARRNCNNECSEAADELEKRADQSPNRARERSVAERCEAFSFLHWHYEQDRDIAWRSLVDRCFKQTIQNSQQQACCYRLPKGAVKC